MKTVHHIIAHPRENSFNFAIKAKIEEYLLGADYHLLKSDLYQMLKHGNKAVEFFGLDISPDAQLDIVTEQNKFKAADLTIVQFPMYWFSFPGILKSYLDRVWEHGFAYPGSFGDAPLADGRKVVFIITTQSPREAYTQQGINGDLFNNLYPMMTAFRFIGYDILPPYVAYNVGGLSTELAKKHFHAVVNHLEVSFTTSKPVMMTTSSQLTQISY